MPNVYTDKPRPKDFYLWVTAEQFSEGWLEEVGLFVHRRRQRFTPVAWGKDGTVLVVNPKYEVAK